MLAFAAFVLLVARRRARLPVRIAGAAQLVAFYSAQMQAVLAQAVALDVNTAGVISANLPR
jgi:hypothetical protein